VRAQAVVNVWDEVSGRLCGALCACFQRCVLAHACVPFRRQGACKSVRCCPLLLAAMSMCSHVQPVTCNL
jgi:hypothetical protein